MCGIVGAWNWGDERTLELMTDVLAHRGPDGRGVASIATRDRGRVGLGSRRLAILDLSPLGHMPMWSRDRRFCIVYNGEIYNFGALRRQLEAKGYAFRSDTDTEVVLNLYAEYGEDCVGRLDGIFALAIWDDDRQRLFLARDGFGVKPLYYRAVPDGRFAFASETKALLRLPGFSRELDWEALDQYMTFLWVPEPRTLLRGVEKLPPGHWMTVGDGRVCLRRYWDLDVPPAGTVYPDGEEELVEQTRGHVRDAVGAQMISDVPIGAFLSAGLDSSTIVAMMAGRTNGAPLRTYTITIPPGQRRGDPTADDPAVSRKVAERFGCDWHEIVLEAKAAELLPRLIWHLDDPVADPAAITAYEVCRMARGSATVLLSGVGGDELFAGYRKYIAHYYAHAYRRLPGWVRGRLIEPAVGRLPVLRGTRFRGFVRLARKMVRSGSLPPVERFLADGTYLSPEDKRRLYTPEFYDRVAGTDPYATHREHFARVAGADFLNQMLYVDVKTFMVSLNLLYNDKMSMAASVEVRVPFLDRALAEFAFRNVPPCLKLKGRVRPTTKYLLREAMGPVLPPEVFGQPKAGFGAPLDDWLADDLRPLTDELLSESAVRGRGLFHPREVRRMVDDQRAGRKDCAYQVWQLLTLELWMRTFLDRDGAAPID